MVSLTVSQSLVPLVAHSEFSALSLTNSKKSAFSEILRPKSAQYFSAKQPNPLSRFTLLSSSRLQSEENIIAFSDVRVRASKSGGSRKTKGIGKPVSKKKESVWNDDLPVTSISNQHNRKSGGRRRQGSPSSGNSRKRKDGVREHASELDSSCDKETALTRRIVVSAAMPVETEAVLQTQEPSLAPLWKTFCSSLCGVWRGVGAAFSPTTAEMEPIAVGDNNEYLYDSRIYSTVEETQGSNDTIIHRKTCWAVGNPYGEEVETKLGSQVVAEEIKNEDVMSEGMEEEISGHAGMDTNVGHILPEDVLDMQDVSSEFSLDLSASTDVTQTDEELVGREWVTENLDDENLRYENVMDEDAMELEPGIVFFEDGAYSRGPLDLLVGDSSTEFASPTYMIEQCLVKGGHTKLRLVHTIAVEQGGEEIEVLRVAVYEEEWMGPCNMKSISDTGGHHLRLFSQRKRQVPQDLVGSWKVFEVSAIAVLPEKTAKGEALERPPYAYFTEETLKQRHLPEMRVQSVAEGLLDMQGIAIMWLPGGVTAYLDTKDNGTLTIGVGWYSDGVNLVMEREYNASGKLHEVRIKSEVKGGWIGGRM